MSCLPIMHFKASYELTGFWSRASDLVLWVHAWWKRHSQIFIASASAPRAKYRQRTAAESQRPGEKSSVQEYMRDKSMIVSCRGPDYCLFSLFFVSLTLNSTICLARGPPLSWGGSNNCERTVFSPQNALFKGIAQPKNKTGWSLNHPQAISRWDCFFTRTDLEK